MTFRIDHVEKTLDGRWRCDFKGVEGKGVYGTMLTNPDGHGLFLAGAPEHEARELLNTGRFRIPLSQTTEQACARFAAALWQLGWGPEIDRENKSTL